uniref:Rx N-terminal domain-containing protein n=1 Tax=Oryza meridionalis TaxID=40149 RepID=A0A0E0F2U5_9ORYZ
MEFLVSAVASDLIGRFISSLTQNYNNHTCKEDDRRRLERILLRMHSVVEEAERRHITNQGMLLQLKGLIEGFYLGYYMLDKIKFQPPEEESIEDEVSHEIQSFALSACNSRKRFRFVDAIRKHTPVAFGSKSKTNLKDVVDGLETKIADMREFVILLGSQTRLPRQPYSTYLYIDNCMFGRRIEKEQVINFLLCNDPHDPYVSILPIIGPQRIGKKTLVQHACLDERVRNCFSHIFFFKEDNLKTGELSLNSKASQGKYLFVIEFIWDVDEAAWTKFQSYLQNMPGTGIKVVVIGGTEDILKFGTVQPIRLKRLSEEEYWYYFKALAFGSMDPDEHPKLASLGMQLATEMRGGFLGATVVGGLLRANPSTQFWQSMLLCIREVAQKHLSSFGVHPEDLLERNTPLDFTRVAFVGAQVQGCLVYDVRVAGPGSELPKLTSQDLKLGADIPAEDKFDVLVWKSRIPPYSNYIVTYEKRKRRYKVPTVFANHPAAAAASGRSPGCSAGGGGGGGGGGDSRSLGHIANSHFDHLLPSRALANMEILISAVASDLISRFISSVTQNYRSHIHKEDDRRRLERILLRMHSVVEEAGGRHITNQGMILQLKGLVEGFYLGYYMLDKIKFQPPEYEELGVMASFAHLPRSPPPSLVVVLQELRVTASFAHRQRPPPPSLVVGLQELRDAASFTLRPMVAAAISPPPRVTWRQIRSPSGWRPPDLDALLPLRPDASVRQKPDHFANSHFDLQQSSGDLISRFISSVAQNYRNHIRKEDDRSRLERILLRMHCVVEEAEGRHITNQGMLLQLKGFIEGFYLGYFMLDKIKFQPPEEESIEDEVSHEIQSFALSACNSRKRFRFADAIRKHTPIAFGSRSRTNLKDVVDGLETKIADMREFVILLGSHPRLPRQPYSTYLYIDNCMFGRRIEKEQVINFLLCNDPHDPYVSILPIIGPPRIGKKTLVQHACLDERVRNCFSHIFFFKEDDLRTGELSLNSKASQGKYLFVIEFIWDVHEAAWTKFQSYLQNMPGTGIKVVVIGTTEDIAKFGTTQPIRSKRKSTQKSDGSVIDRRWCGEEEKMAGEEGGWWCELAAAAEATRFKVNLSAGSSLRYNNITATTQARKMIRILLRMHSVVEEAEGRHITNQGMLLQLKGLIEGFYHGYHMLDKVTFQPPEEESIKDEVIHEINSSALITSNSAKRFRFADALRKHTPISFASRSTTNLKGVVEDLETKIADMREFVMLLGSYPRLPRQPYSTYLFMDKCMFGRRVEKEKEKVIDFLLCSDLPDTYVSILPIIGPHRIGKKTLVQHACQDDRVKSCFSHIFFFKEDDLKMGELSLNSKASPGKYLFVIEFICDHGPNSNHILQNMPSTEFKVVIIGRTEDVTKFGTTQPIKMKRLSEEEYWYYFKALSFGSMNPDEHPKLASLGMQLATEMNGSFLGANILGELLRANPNTQFWQSILLSLRGFVQKNLCCFGVHPEDLLERNTPVDFTRMAFLGAQVHGCLVYDLRVAGPAQSQLPKLTSREVLLGGNIPVEQKFDVLVWKSRIPPYCDYIATFEKQKPRHTVGEEVVLEDHSQNASVYGQNNKL